jgi:hypothetical protein
MVNDFQKYGQCRQTMKMTITVCAGDVMFFGRMSPDNRDRRTVCDASIDDSLHQRSEWKEMSPNDVFGDACTE